MMKLFRECKILFCFLREKNAYADSNDDFLLKKQLPHQSAELRTFWSYPSAPPSSPIGGNKPVSGAGKKLKWT